MTPSSATDRAPKRLTTPPRIQTNVTNDVDGRRNAMVLGTMKMPEAIMLPTLIIVESRRDKSLRSSVEETGGSGGERVMREEVSWSIPW